MSGGDCVRRRAASWLLILSTVAIVSWFALETGQPAMLGGENPGVSSIEKEAECSLGQFIPAMACQKNTETAACCGGLKVAFNARCPCRPLPSIVMSHGGQGLHLMDNMIRCGYTDGTDVNGDPVPPVEYVTEHLGCADRKEWCADKLHNIDVRLTRSHKGFVQVHDAKKGWVYAQVDAQNAKNTAHSVCAALGYRSVIDAKTGTTSMGSVHASKRLNCPTPKSPIAKCSVEDISLQANSGFFIECDREGPNGEYRPENCIRINQDAPHYNNLNCEPSPTGIKVPSHVRRVGAAHTLCGTAGVNESRIAWADGYQDDFYAFVGHRSQTGAMLYATQTKEVQGADLLTEAELLMDERKALVEEFRSSTPTLASDLKNKVDLHPHDGFDWDW